MHRMARKLGKPLESIAPATLSKLNNYSWPGNIRDLQNTIERAAVLSSGPVLSVEWDLGPPASVVAANGNGATHFSVPPRIAHRAAGIPKP